MSTSANAHFATYVEHMEKDDSVPFDVYCQTIDTLVEQGETLTDYYENHKS